MGTGMHSRKKSNPGSTEKFQEAGSHFWGCLFAGSEVKGQGTVPRGTGGQSRTLKQGLSSASEGLSARKKSKARDLGTEVYVRLATCQNQSQDQGQQASSQGDKSKSTLG